jgi:hypothetical protein
MSSGRHYWEIVRNCSWKSLIVSFYKF